MKKLLVIILALSLTISLAGCGGPTDDEIKAVRNVSFEGTELTVTLGTNKTTGFEWDYEIYGECIEPSGNNIFKLTGSHGDATGEDNTGFKGLNEGTAVIVFATPNGWDGTGEGEGYTVTVEVASDGKILSAVGKEGANVPEPPPKTSVTIAELAEGTYTGTMSGDEYSNENKTVFVTIQSADVTLTIENGQITLFCDAICNAYGMLQGEKTPEAPEGSILLSGSLPLEQSGDDVTARGEIPVLGEGFTLNYTDGMFTGWELKEREGKSKFACTVNISMENGVPVATFTADVSDISRTATVLLALASGTDNTESEKPLSAPYAEMLKNGDYQYTYALDYEGKPYTATIATYNGMICRKVVSDDGTSSQRVVTIDGHAWKVDELTGAVVDGGTENAETLPDYASTLSFVASRTLDTGAIADAYDFEYEGQKCNLVFLFTPQGELAELIITAGDNTSEMEIRNFSSVGNDRTLFDAPQ